MTVMAGKGSGDARTLEAGNVYFFYRPRVETEDPDRLGDVQRLFLVLAPDGERRFRLLQVGRKHLGEPEAKGRDKVWAFVQTVGKNPDQPSPKSAGLPEKHQPDYPKRLQEVFRGRKFGELDPPDVLDVEGTELVLVSAAADVEDELGVTLDTADETRRSADMFRELHLEAEQHPVRPLFEGRWE